MFFYNNLKFLFKDIDKKAFCFENKIPYRTFQDVYSGKTKDPRMSFLIQISMGISISLDDLIYKDLSKESKWSNPNFKTLISIQEELWSSLFLWGFFKSFLFVTSSRKYRQLFSGGFYETLRKYTISYFV